MDATNLAPPSRVLGAVRSTVALHHAIGDGGRATDPRLVLVNDTNSDAAARYRILRHRLLKSDAFRRLMVTSPGPSQGRTTCAANLSLALAEDGKLRVLLLEAQVSNPQLELLFGFTTPACIYEQIRNRNNVGGAAPLKVTEVSAGGYSIHVGAISASSKKPFLNDGSLVADALGTLRPPTYDYVIVDAPPVLGSADANVLSEGCDAYVISAWAGRCRLSEVRQSVDQLGPDRCLGAVFFGV